MTITREALKGLSLLAALLLVVGCAPEEEDHVPPAAVAQAEEPEAEEPEPARARPFLPASMRRSTRAESFPHETHAEISCAVCHEAVEGHDSHRTFECAECHRSSALVTQQQVSREECLACHHGPLQEAECLDCHGDVGQRVAAWPLHLGIWPGPRNRSLPFQHEVHGARDCSSCHRQMPTLVPDIECGSCHEDHHRPEARCMTCHAQPAEGVHDVDAHLGCTGAGCHTDARFEALAQVRATCLVCHQAQEDHEPGQECAECHQVRRPDDVPLEARGPYVHAEPLGSAVAGGRR